MTQTTTELPTEAISALERGSKIEAIKVVRLARHVDLKDAKDIVENYIDSHPDMAQRMATANAQAAKGALSWVIPVVLLGLAAYYIFGK